MLGHYLPFSLTTTTHTHTHRGRRRLCVWDKGESSSSALSFSPVLSRWDLEEVSDWEKLYIVSLFLWFTASSSFDSSVNLRAQWMKGVTSPSWIYSEKSNLSLVLLPCPCLQRYAASTHLSTSSRGWMSVLYKEPRSAGGHAATLRFHPPESKGFVVLWGLGSRTKGKALRDSSVRSISTQGWHGEATVLVPPSVECEDLSIKRKRRKWGLRSRRFSVKPANTESHLWLWSILQVDVFVKLGID